MLLGGLLLILVGSLLALVFALNALINVFRFRVPYVTTPSWAIAWMENNLSLDQRDVVYDLGCGDARVLTSLARQFPRAKFIGIENQWWPFLLAKWRSRQHPNVTILKQNFYKLDLSNATVIFCFLIDSVMPKLETKLRRELRPGARIFSYGFRFPAWHPAQEIVNPQRPHGSQLRIYS